MYEEIITGIRRLYNQPDGVIPLHVPVFAGNEKALLADCIDSTYVSSIGSYVNRFEEMICEITGAQHAVAVVNGTSALHLALMVAGVSDGDEVLTQPLSFVATANAIAYSGARPVFLDVDRSTMGLSPDSVDRFLEENAEMHAGKCLNKKTGNRITACVPMHTFGHPCRVDRIVDICKHYHVEVIEDAAESLGSTYFNKHTGTFGLAGIFSFNGNKIVTCGGGGILITDNSEFAKRATFLSTTAKTDALFFEHTEIGYNYRLPNINAALACAQLGQLDSFVKNKRQIAGEYANLCKRCDIQFVQEPENTVSNYWLNSIVLANRSERNRFLEETNEQGIMTRPAWKLLNTLPMYQSCVTDSLENATWLADRLVNLPSSVR